VIQSGQPDAYDSVVDEQVDHVYETIGELPELPPVEPVEPVAAAAGPPSWEDVGIDAPAPDVSQQAWPDMGADARTSEVVQQPWAETTGASTYVSLDPVELSGCCALCHDVSAEYEDVAAQLTVTPELETVVPSLTDTLQALRQALQALAFELSGEAGMLDQAQSAVDDPAQAARPLSGYGATAFGSADATAVSAAWGPGVDASTAHDPNVVTIGGGLDGSYTQPPAATTYVVGNAWGDVLSTGSPQTVLVVGGGSGLFSGGAEGPGVTVSIGGGSFADQVAAGETAVANSGYMNETVAAIGPMHPPTTWEGAFGNSIVSAGLVAWNNQHGYPG
jgi:hypothetical protein